MAAFGCPVFFMRDQLPIFLCFHCKSQYVVFYWFLRTDFWLSDFHLSGVALGTSRPVCLKCLEMLFANLMVFSFGSLPIFCAPFCLHIFSFRLNIFIHLIASCFWGSVNFSLVLFHFPLIFWTTQLSSAVPVLASANANHYLALLWRFFVLFLLLYIFI